MFKFKDEMALVHRLADVVVFLGYHAEGAIRG